jgi:hypothetical protein
MKVYTNKEINEWLEGQHNTAENLRRLKGKYNIKGKYCLEISTEIVEQLQKENERLKKTMLSPKETKYLIKFLTIRLKTSPNQAIEQILQTLKGESKCL